MKEEKKNKFIPVVFLTASDCSIYQVLDPGIDLLENFVPIMLVDRPFYS